MGLSKPMGIDKKEYIDSQKLKSEDDFRFTTNQRIQNLQFAIDMINDSLSKSIAEQGSLSTLCKTQINEILNTTITSLNQFKQSLGDIYTEFSKSERYMNHLNHQLNQMVDVSTFNEKISQLNDQIKSLHIVNDSMKRDFKDMIDQLKSEFQTKLKSLKEEIISIPSELPKLQKEVDQKIELVELNGQNAVLRSSNNEKQIMLVERKIENIYQLIKKLELQ